MAVVAIIKCGEVNKPALVERIKAGDTFCFVVNQKALPWRVAPMNGRDNLGVFEDEIRAAGGDPSISPLRKKHLQHLQYDEVEA